MSLLPYSHLRDVDTSLFELLNPAVPTFHHFLLSVFVCVFGRCGVRRKGGKTGGGIHSGQEYELQSLAA